MYIEESGMTFGYYDKNMVFVIESWDEYVHHLKPNGVNTVEFILMRKDSIFFIEAKTSTPDYHNYKNSKQKTLKYNEYVESIVKKFTDSVSLYMSILLKRTIQNGVPDEFLKDSCANSEFVLILVVKNGFEDSLRHYKEKFEYQLKPMMKTWNINKIFVIDEQTAKNKGIVL